MTVNLCSPDSVGHFTFAVVFSRYRGQWLFSRKKGLATWEPQGGHIEPGETPLEAARRELYEESGGIAKALLPICAYCVERGTDELPRYGMIYLADITHLHPMPHSEMEEAALFDGLPPALTYPDITPLLFEEILHTLRQKEQI